VDRRGIRVTADDAFVIIRSFSHPHEAHLALSALEGAGIEARLADEHIIAADWLYSNAVGGAKVLVRLGDADAARAILETPATVFGDHGDLSDTDGDACRRCGGRRLVPESPGRRGAFLTWLLAGIPLVPVGHRRRCADCGWRTGSQRA
jgi:hypothetical protein